MRLNTETTGLYSLLVYIQYILTSFEFIKTFGYLFIMVFRKIIFFYFFLKRSRLATKVLAVITAGLLNLSFTVVNTSNNNDKSCSVSNESLLQ